MGPMKRPSAATPTVAAKKSRPATAEDPAVAAKVGAITALVAASGLPDSVVQLLTGTIASSLGTVKEQRHANQTQAIGFLEEALTMAKAKSEAKLSELTAQLTNFDAEKTTRATAAEAAAATLSEKAKAEEDAKAALTVATEAVAAAKAALAVAEQDQISGDAEAQAAEGKKATLEATVVVEFGKLKAGEFSAALFKSFQKLAKEFGFDTNMVAAAQAALKKVPDQRGEFDNTVVAEVEGAIAKAAASLTEIIATAAPAKEARAAKVSESDAAVTAAQDSEAAAKSALSLATAEHKPAAAGKKAADKAVKDCSQDFKRLQTDVALATSELEEVVGTIKAFQELVERTAPPPEPEAAPAVAASEEAAAVSEAAPVQA